MYPPLQWQHQFSGPAPPSPVVVTTIPEYFGGQPTPPFTPPRLCPIGAIDPDAPCPPTPQCVPPDADSDRQGWSTAPGSESSVSASPDPHDYWPPPKSDPSANSETSNDFAGQVQLSSLPHGPEPAHPSDRLLYARTVYAWPGPVLLMMQRASLDAAGLETQPVNPYWCGLPLKLFSLTGGRIPLTGLREHDDQSFRYYTMRPHASLLRNPESPFAYRYATSSVQLLKNTLQKHFSSAYPAPIPPVIIRLRDLVGPRSFDRRLNCSAFVVPTKDTIWSTICERGVDWDFKPMNPSLTVETCIVTKGAALYYPQHTVASKFAVNVFLEVADSETSSIPQCEYLGAYVMQTMGSLVMNRAAWTSLRPEIRMDVNRRVFGACSLGFVRLPRVQFHFYKWDTSIIGWADECTFHSVALPASGVFERMVANEHTDSDDCSDDSDSDDYESTQ